MNCTYVGKLHKIRFFFRSEWRMPNARNKIKIHLKNCWINWIWCLAKSPFIRRRSIVKRVSLLIISNCLLRYRCKLHIANTRTNIAQIVSQDKAICYSWIVHIAPFPLTQFIRELEIERCKTIAEQISLQFSFQMHTDSGIKIQIRASNDIRYLNWIANSRHIQCWW